MQSLVSCILPTRDRADFFRQAIRCFLRQSWDNSELIVVDDGVEPVEDLCTGLSRVRYLRLHEPACLGAKLNIGIAQSNGELIQKLDDDDYYHPLFLERAVSEFRRAGSEDVIVAWDCFHVLVAGEDSVTYSGHGWAAGGTLLFHRRNRNGTAFREISLAEDHAFIADHQGALHRVCAPDLYLLVRHRRNTWTTMDGVSVDDYFRHRRGPRKSLSEVVEPIDLPFYSSLGRAVEG